MLLHLQQLRAPQHRTWSVASQPAPAPRTAQHPNIDPTMHSVQRPARGLSASRPSTLCPSRSCRPVLPARPSRKSAPVSALGTVDTIRLVSQIATSVSLAVGAWWFSREAMLEQDRFDNSQQQACPRCDGTGFEACMCSRWSDSDIGCSTCSRSGYMRCRSCGGGGTAVPIKVAIRKDGTQQQM